jgi:hypothetical protein
MPRGDKSSYTGKQKRQAEHIEKGYERKGISKKTAEKRAWATVNKQDGGGKKKSTARKKTAAKKTARKKTARKTTARKTTARKKSGARKSARSKR